MSDAQGAWIGAASLEEIDLVGEADPDQRAARALGAVPQGRRHLAPRGDEPKTVDGRERHGPQFLIELDAHPLARSGEIEDARLAPIAVLLEDHPLHAELHAFGVVGPLTDMRSLAALVVHRRDHIPFALDQIELRDEPEPAR